MSSRSPFEDPQSFRASLLAVLRGEWLPEWLARALLVPFTALAEAAVLFFLGAILTLRTSQIKSADRLWLPWDHGTQFSVWATVYWVGLFLWIVVFFLRRVAGDIRRSESEDEVRRHAERLHHAILRSPSPTLVTQYKDHVSRCDASIRKALAVSGSDRKEALKSAIHDVLREALDMARNFARNPQKVTYSANVMFIIPPSSGDPPYPSKLVHALRFFDPETMNLKGLKCLLYIRPELVVPEEGEPKTPPIALPVPSQAQVGTGSSARFVALPGAPYALLEGQMSVFETPEKLVGWCRERGDFMPSIIDEIENYFSSGDGASIGSFLSIRIGTAVDPVGVLNIDSTGSDLLGAADEEYWITFEAFMSPVVTMLAPVATEYYSLCTGIDDH